VTIKKSLNVCYLVKKTSVRRTVIQPTVGKIFVFSLVVFLLANGLHAQVFTLHGTVTDSATGKPIAAASVFLSNTSIGTAADINGGFVINNVQKGNFTLVVSSLGYATFAKSINTEKQQESLNITLRPKANELSAVIIGAYEKDGWRKWDTLFIANFIGISFFASQCTLKNPEVLKFRYSEKKNFLRVFADEPLILENKALGYVVHYKLEEFTYDFATPRVYYVGFPLFAEMAGAPRKQKKWKEHRKDVYYGSIMHFMRCLYTNKLAENGYEVKRYEKVPNIEKQRILTLYHNYINLGHTRQDLENILTEDTANYYNKILSQPDEVVVKENALLTSDSIAHGLGTDSTVLQFNNYLNITYKKKKAPLEYLQHTVNSEFIYSPYVTSQVRLFKSSPITVLYNGAYYPPQNMFSAGYWGWSEKLAFLLPYDYWP